MLIRKEEPKDYEIKNQRRGRRYSWNHKICERIWN